MVAAHKRRSEIIDVIKSEGSAKVEKLVHLFDVSAVTIRHDLKIIEKEHGCITRCHGGAVINDDFSFDLPVNKKRTNGRVKLSLGRHAANLVRNGDSIILDSGSTVEHITTFLGDREDLVVMTNSLNIACELYNHSNIELTVLGGSVRKDSASMISLSAEIEIREHRFDKLFLEADGFDIEMGITTPHQDEAAIKRAMCEVAKEVIVIADSSKLEKICYCSICDISRVSTLITDSGISEKLSEDIKGKGINIITVE